MSALAPGVRACATDPAGPWSVVSANGRPERSRPRRAHRKPVPKMRLTTPTIATGRHSCDNGFPPDLAKPNLFHQRGPLRGIIRCNHGIVKWQIPFLANCSGGIVDVLSQRQFGDSELIFDRARLLLGPLPLAVGVAIVRNPRSHGASGPNQDEEPPMPDTKSRSLAHLLMLLKL